MRKQKVTHKMIYIGADSWIGDGAIVGADVGSHAVVGAGSVVIDPVPDYARVAGVPARNLMEKQNDTK